MALAGKLEIYQDEAWAKAARRALRVLHLHKQWISRELKERKRVKALSEQEQVAVSAASARAAVHEKYAEERRRAAALKMNLVEAANNETARHISVFKKVAREVLGDAMYERLWELTRARLEGQG